MGTPLPRIALRDNETAAHQQFLWPYRTRPYEGETLSSWLSRLAAGNGLRFTDVLQYLGISLWECDIDCLPATEWLTRLSATTGTTTSEVWKTTLSSLERRVLKRNRAGDLEGVLPLRAGPHKRRLFGFQICPECVLETDYYRIIWRLSFVTMCSRHDILLIDRCCWCRRPLRPRAREPRKGVAGAIPACWSCDMPLRSPAANIPDGIRSFQASLESIVTGECVAPVSDFVRYLSQLSAACIVAAMARKDSELRFERRATGDRALLINLALTEL